MLERWREQVPEANLEFVRSGLVLYTFGNASGISRERGLGVIKPSGVPYERLKPAHVTVVNLNGKIVQASSDHRPTCPPIACSTTPLLRSAWWPTRIPNMPPSGRRRARPFRVSGQRMPTLSMVRFRSSPGRDWRAFLRLATRVTGSASSLVPGNKHLLFSVRARTTSIEVHSRNGELYG
jgi:hypothetical protein